MQCFLCPCQLVCLDMLDCDRLLAVLNSAPTAIASCTTQQSKCSILWPGYLQEDAVYTQLDASQYDFYDVADGLLGGSQSCVGLQCQQEPVAGELLQWGLRCLAEM